MLVDLRKFVVFDADLCGRSDGTTNRDPARHTVPGQHLR